MKASMIGLVVLMLAAIVRATPAEATVFTYNLSTVLSGNDPMGTSPWLVVTIADTETADNVQITIDANNLAANGQFVTKVYFNSGITLGASDFSGFSPNPASLTFCSGNQAQCKADGDGYFDFVVNFATASGADRFNGGETESFTVAHAGLSATSFNSVSAPGGGNGNYYVAAHIQGIPVNCSSWIGALGNPGSASSGGPCDAQVPVPSTLILFGSGLLILGVATRRKHRRG